MNLALRLLLLPLFSLLATSATFAGAGSKESSADQPAVEVTSNADKDAPRFKLAYKFEMGEVIKTAVDHRMSMRSTIESTTQEVMTRTDSVKVWKITDVLPSGEIELVNMVERVKMINKLADRAEMRYDSEKDKTPPQGSGWDDVAKSIGVPLSVIRIKPSGNIVERDVKHKQPAADTEAPITLLLPEEPVAVGDTWDEPRTVPIRTQDGAVRKIQARRHYKLAKVDDGVATIEVTYQVLTPIDPQIESQIVQRLMKGKAKFDIESGRMVSQQYDVDKRILGFSGPTSSMHYIMRMIEKPHKEETKKVASKPE